jgi:gas vesicle protein
MKSNRGLIIGLAAAGLAIAGCIVFLTATKSGKRNMNRWRGRRRKISEGVREIIKDAKRKIKDLKAEVAKEYKTDDAIAIAYE